MRLLLSGFLLSCLLAGALPAAELETDVIHSNRAAELQAVLAPLAAPEGHVSVYQDQLVVRATPEKLDLIRDTLRRLDRPLRNLRISVRRARQQDARETAIAARADVRVVDGQPGARLQVEAGERHRQGHQQQRYSVTALEGSTVFIATGSEVPVASVIVTPGGAVATGVTPVPLQSGFRVTPRLQPDGQVLLEIEAQQAEAGPGREIHRETVSTRLRVAPGQWTALGGTAVSATRHQSGSGGSRQQTYSTQAPLEVLVEPLP